MKKNERRKFLRLRAHHLLKYKLANDPPGQKNLSFVIDISAGGVLFYAREKLPEDTFLDLEINFPGSNQPLCIKARVVRLRQLKKIGGFEIGAEFVDPAQDFRILVDQKIIDVYKKSKGGI